MFSKEKSDGSDQKHDTIANEGDNAALDLLKTRIEETKQSITKEEKRKKWEFETSPHEQFGKTLDDTYGAFLAWARCKEDKSKVNVSKAFRRLESYAVCYISTRVYTLHHQQLVLFGVLLVANQPLHISTGLDARDWHRFNRTSSDICLSKKVC